MLPGKSKLTSDETAVWTSSLTAAGQWIIAVGAVMVAIGLTVNSVVAKERAAKDERISGSGAIPR